jgi:hypothetical protein
MTVGTWGTKEGSEGWREGGADIIRILKILGSFLDEAVLVEAMATGEEIELFAEQILHTAFTFLIHSDSISSRGHLSQLLHSREGRRGEWGHWARLGANLFNHFSRIGELFHFFFHGLHTGSVIF